MKNKTLFLRLFCLVLVFTEFIYAADNVIYMYNWFDYMPEAVIHKFSEETGINVIYSTYASNEEMYEKLLITNANGYDLIVPSGYFVSMLVSKGLLRKLDIRKLTNYSNLDKNLLGVNPEYTVPYCWGSTLMLVNSNFVEPSTIKSWNDLFRPEFKGKIGMIDDLRDVFSVALYALGYSINTQNEYEIKEAYEWLKRLKPSIKQFDSETIETAFASGEATIGLVYNGEALQIHKKLPEFVAIYPKEGVSLWIDCFAIPKGAKNVDNAYKFINFILRPEINKMIVDALLYSTPNKNTFALFGKEWQENRIVNPTAAELGKSEFTNYVGSALVIYEKYWEKLKAEP